MANSPMAQESQDFKPNVRQAFGSLRTSIIINAVFPVVIYLLASPHMSTMTALALTAIPPVLYAGYGWMRARSIDLLSIISLFLIVVSMLLALLVHDPHLLMLKDSYETGASACSACSRCRSPGPSGITCTGEPLSGPLSNSRA